MARYEHLLSYNKKAMDLKIHFERILKNVSLLTLVGVLILCCNVGYAGNIDPNNDGSRYAYGENVGWINFAPAQGPGVVVSNTGLTGYAWGENVGWINLSPTNGGVVNDSAGNLSGYAWGENVGWINFDDVKIDPSTGAFSGYAWGENIGWISFSPSGVSIKTSWTPQPDTTPDPFAFTSQTGVALNAVVTSNAVTVTGINMPASISISICASVLCEYSINGGSFTTSAGTVNNSDTVAVRQTSSSSFSTTTTATLTIGGVNGTFSVTTLAADTSPDPFTFTPQTGVALNTVVTSNAVTITGINTPAPISITGGEYSINGGSFTSDPGTVNNGDSVTIRLTTSNNYFTTTSATLTIGGVSGTGSGTFNVTTVTGNIDPNNDGSRYAYGENVGWINFAPVQGPGAVVSSNGLTGYAWGENIGWINLSPTNGGVINDGAGNLSGYAWGENIGWINFSGVKINPSTGAFSGYAWGENIGWINFAPTGGGLKTSWVSDIDNDGIINSIDGHMSGGTFVDESKIYSANFTDVHLGGTTSGNIVNRDGLAIYVEDANPGGVRISTSGGVGTGTINVCGFEVYFTDGDSAIITCGSLTIQVLTGEVKVQVTGNISVMVPDGATAIISNLGNGQYSITNSSGSQEPITIVVNSETIELQPGESHTAVADSDQDGVPDTEDSCPESNLEGTIIIDSCDTGVKNVIVKTGCTMNDLISQCAVGVKNHGKFVSCVANLTNSWKRTGQISNKEKGIIQKCAAQSKIPQIVLGDYI